MELSLKCKVCGEIPVTDKRKLKDWTTINLNCKCGLKLEMIFKPEEK